VNKPLLFLRQTKGENQGNNMSTVFLSILLAILIGSTSPTLKAETISLKQAIKRALQIDPRLRERKKIFNDALAIEQMANESDALLYEVEFFVGLATKKTGRAFTTGYKNQTERPEEHNFEGIAPWYNLRLGIVKPLYSFGKTENFSAAAKENVTVKQGDVALIKSRVKYDVYQTYYQYLAARDSRLLLEDIKSRLGKSISLVEKWLRDGGSNAKQSDVFALQTGAAQVNRYLTTFKRSEVISLGRLKALIGTNPKTKLEVADSRIVPVELPKTTLKTLQRKALANRPELAQLKAGLNGRRNLANTNTEIDINVAINRSANPAVNQTRGIDTALVGSFAVTPGQSASNRDKNFSNTLGQNKTQSILNSLIEKSSFSILSIPLQVSEQYQFVQTHYTIVEELAKGSRAGRRWMISSYADFEAGLVEAEKVMSAFQGYVLAHTDYLKSVSDYNMHVIRLKSVTGEL